MDFDDANIDELLELGLLPVYIKPKPISVTQNQVDLPSFILDGTVDFGDIRHLLFTEPK